MSSYCRSLARRDNGNDEPPDSFKGALPDAMQLEGYKKYRINESRTVSAFQSLTFFVSFLMILGIVCYGNQDYHQYLIGREVKAILPRSEKVKMSCMLEMFIPLSLCKVFPD